MRNSALKKISAFFLTMVMISALGAVSFTGAYAQENERAISNNLPINDTLEEYQRILDKYYGSQEKKEKFQQVIDEIEEKAQDAEDPDYIQQQETSSMNLRFSATRTGEQGIMTV